MTYTESTESTNKDHSEKKFTHCSGTEDTEILSKR